MKKFFVSMAVLMMSSVVCVFAQSNLVATLSHEGEVSVFYGGNALIEAHDAATHGDVITLSSGLFHSPETITKAITLRGAGMSEDSLKAKKATEILDAININIPDSVESNLVMEGIYHGNTLEVYGKLTDAQFIKCSFKRIECRQYSAYLSNATFLHCKITDAFRHSLPYADVIFINSYIRNTYGSSGNSYHFVNSIIDHSSRTGAGLLSGIEKAIFENSILIGSKSASHDFVGDTSDASFCVAVNIGYSKGCFVSCPATNKEVGTFEELFKTYRGGEYDRYETFELTDEAKEKYLGNDGSQVGIYGGKYPFSVKTSVPHITKCVVPAESDANGKLNVQIEINGAE